MIAPDICENIRHSSIFSNLDEAQCKELSSIATTKDLADGEVLIQEGCVDDTLYILVDGHLAVERVTTGGDTISLHCLKQGDLAGEMGFVDGTGHTATLRAIGQTQVVCINRSDFESLVSANPGVVYGVMRGIVRTVHRILREMNLQFVELHNYITKIHGRY